MNISDLIDQYEQGARLRGLAPTQLQALKPIRRALGRRTANNLTPGVINSYVAERRRGEHSLVHGTRPAADGTVRRELGALAAVVNWAHQKRLLTTAPPTIDLPPMSPPREVFLDFAQAEALWDYAAGWTKDSTGVFVCLALDTWARAASIETLPWSRVDLERGQIDYRDPLRPETSKRRVPVPISSRLAEALTVERAAHEEACGVLSCPVVGPVTQHMWRRFTDLACPPSWPKITRHDLRRTGISLAVARGVDLMKIAQMAGDNYETVIRHYARFAPDYLDGVVE